MLVAKRRPAMAWRAQHAPSPHLAGRISSIAVCGLRRTYIKARIKICAEITRKNIVSGYTVEYATAGASLLAVLLL